MNCCNWKLTNLIRTFAWILIVSLFIGCSEKTATELAREKADPNAVRYLILAEDANRIGAYNSALAYADSAKALEPDLADIHFMYGLIFNNTRRLDDANKAFEEVVALDPKYKGVWLQLGHTAYHADDFRRALRFYQRENQNYPSASIWYSVGWCYEKLGASDSARTAYEKALTLDENYSLAYLRLGHVCKDSGDLEKALQYAQAGLALEPENLDYGYFVGSMLMLKGDAEAAYPHLQKVVAARPSHYWANYSLGQALVRLNRKPEGEHYLAVADSLFAVRKLVDHWRNLAKENPDQMGIWVNLGNALRLANEIEEAIEAFKMAIYLGPGQLTLYNDLANLFLMSGDTLKARMLYQTILAKNPGMSEVWLNLGVLHANSGRKAQARMAWEKVLQLSPGDETATKYLAELDK